MRGVKARTVFVGLVLFALIAIAQPTVSVTPLAVTPGGVVTVLVKGGTAGEKCGIEIKDPLYFRVFVMEITLSPAGNGSALWQIPTTARLGTYTVYVSCETSGAAPPITLRVTPLVGGEARKDLAPFLMTALAALTLGLSAAGIVRKFKK